MTLTRSMTTPKIHILDFYTDSNNASALTVYVENLRFHIIADPADLDTNKKAKKSGSGRLQQQYLRLVEAIKGEGEEKQTPRNRKDEETGNETTRDEQEEDDEKQEIWCTCRQPEHGNEMIACDNDDCRYQWFHLSCIGLDSAPSGEWTCPECSKSSPASDSGVDVSTPEVELEDAREVRLDDSADQDPESKLQKWMLSPFESIFAPLVPSERKRGQQKEGQHRTLEEWYNPKTRFYNLELQSSELVAVQIEATDELNKRLEGLTPRLAIPKYITNLDIPLHHASDITVLHETEDALNALRPTRVRVGDNEYFVKMVDNSNPQPTKREIKIMKQIEQLGLHEQFKVPRVTGLVGHGDSKSTIMGFLQTEIPSPTPLTGMIDSDVSQKKRDAWAAESERIVSLLHEHKIIFGDCKADNFLVDGNEDLWIIDFGGSYTDGWVDPELAETEEGDDLAVEKIVNALNDPDANTIDPDDEAEEQQQRPKDQREKREDSGKRKRDHDASRTCADWEDAYGRSDHKSRKVTAT